MQIRASVGGDHQVVSVNGHITHADLTRLRDELLRLLHTGGARMVLDLSPGLGLREESQARMTFVLAATCRRAALLGGWVRLVCQTPWRALLDEASLGDVIECYDDVPSARAAARRSEVDVGRLGPHLGSAAPV